MRKGPDPGRVRPLSPSEGKIGFGDWGRRVVLSPDYVGEVGIWEVIGFDSDHFVAGVFEPLLRLPETVMSVRYVVMACFPFCIGVIADGQWE